MSQGGVMIMAGGTGGHIFPALAVARDLMAREVPVAWLGSRGGMEERLIPDTGIPASWIRIKGLRGKGLLSWLVAPFRLMVALIQAGSALRKNRPSVVLGMGGFAAGPGGMMARLMGIPLVIHEQNSVAGMTNRLLARMATRVLQAFPGSFGSDEGVATVGNPIRAEIADLPVRDERATGAVRVLIIGGSRGAMIFNQIVPEALSLISASQRPEVLHQCGEQHLEATQKAYGVAGVNGQVQQFIADMASAYQWADLVICRAGAMTISELAAVGLPSVLVPYPFAVDDHQTGNARYLADANAAVLLPQTELTAQSLAEVLENISGDPELLRNMGQQARSIASPDAARRVADVCLQAGGLQ
jgi:UDP-N-acetylglucosamine--N-acetylmuramyl-(pentapeptide) pyrophosphoryl-undecaprenol N-acetylglucosamine transferase